MFKKTKIVATISDVKCDVEFLKQIIDAGVNVIRLNTAHQSFEGTKKVIDNVRKVSEYIPLMLDTKGPEIRTNPSENQIHLKKGERIFVSGENKPSDEKCIFVSYKNFYKDIPVKSKILIDDGEIELEVIEKKNNKLLCIAKNEGTVKGRKSINVPDAKINLPTLNSKDREYIDFAIKNNLDFIAHSFVRNKKDLQEIQSLLDKNKSKIKIISKIENQEGVDNIDDILENSYGIMVARGDLGIEISAEKIPSIQRMIIKKCIEKRKPVIVATQMLHTMIKNPRPTRAEVSDVANAIYLGADAIMLSGETAYGDYPLEAVKIMAKISREVEKNKEPIDESSITSIHEEVPGFITKSAVKASLLLPIKAIVADTTTGRTARYLSAYRGKIPIFVLCYDKKVARELNLSYGVYTKYNQFEYNKKEMMKILIDPLLKEKLISKDNLVVLVVGNFGAICGTSTMEISTVDNLLNRRDKIETGSKPKHF